MQQKTQKFTPKENQYLVKVVVIGDINVGKTNIIHRLMGEEFREMESTVGVEFAYLTKDNIDEEDPKKSLAIQIWDTSGAERYRAITTSHIRNSDGAYIVYDVTNETSFSNLPFWYNLIKEATDDDIVIYLIGNKIDLIYEQGRMVNKNLAVNFVREYNLQGYAECSAKTNENVEEIFQSFYKTLYKRNKNKLFEKTNKRVNDTEKILKTKNQNRCCD
jgi:small GTP-binding protein